MAKEPRLANLFDSQEDAAGDTHQNDAQPSGRPEDENLSQQYYGTVLIFCSLGGDLLSFYSSDARWSASKLPGCPTSTLMRC